MENQPGRDESGASQGPGMVAKLAEQVGEKATRMKEAVVDLGRRTVGDIDAQRNPAAAMLDHTAAALHQKTDRVASLAHSTAEQFQATAHYVRDHDVNAMGRDLQDLVRRYPARALVGAAVIGFVIARAVRTRA
jgi:hypothetical protein